MAARAIKTDRPFAAALVAAILMVGFSRSFFLMPLFRSEPGWAAKEPIFFIHGTVFSCWFALLAYRPISSAPVVDAGHGKRGRDVAARHPDVVDSCDRENEAAGDRL